MSSSRINGDYYCFVQEWENGPAHVKGFPNAPLPAPWTSLQTTTAPFVSSEFYRTYLAKMMTHLSEWEIVKFERLGWMLNHVMMTGEGLDSSHYHTQKLIELPTQGLAWGCTEQPRFDCFAVQQTMEAVGGGWLEIRIPAWATRWYRDGVWHGEDLEGLYSPGVIALYDGITFYDDPNFSWSVSVTAGIEFNDKLYVGSESGVVYLCDTSRRIFWQVFNSGQEVPVTRMAATPSYAFAAVGKKLWRMDAEHKRAVVGTFQDDIRDIVTWGNHVFVVQPESVHIYDASDGSWRIRTFEGESLRIAKRHGNETWVIGDAGALLVYDWQFNVTTTTVTALTGEIMTAGTFDPDSGTLYVGTEGGNIYTETDGTWALLSNRGVAIADIKTLGGNVFVLMTNEWQIYDPLLVTWEAVAFNPWGDPEDPIEGHVWLPFQGDLWLGHSFGVELAEWSMGGQFQWFGISRSTEYDVAVGEGGTAYISTGASRSARYDVFLGDGGGTIYQDVVALQSTVYDVLLGDGGGAFEAMTATRSAEYDVIGGDGGGAIGNVVVNRLTDYDVIGGDGGGAIDNVVVSRSTEYDVIAGEGGDGLGTITATRSAEYDVIGGEGGGSVVDVGTSRSMQYDVACGDGGAASLTFTLSRSAVYDVEWNGTPTDVWAATGRSTCYDVADGEGGGKGLPITANWLAVYDVLLGDGGGTVQDIAVSRSAVYDVLLGDGGGVFLELSIRRGTAYDIIAGDGGGAVQDIVVSRNVVYDVLLGDGGGTMQDIAVSRSAVYDALLGDGGGVFRMLSTNRSTVYDVVIGNGGGAYLDTVAVRSAFYDVTNGDGGGGAYYDIGNSRRTVYDVNGQNKWYFHQSGAIITPMTYDRSVSGGVLALLTLADYHEHEKLRALIKPNVAEPLTRWRDYQIKTKFNEPMFLPDATTELTVAVYREDDPSMKFIDYAFCPIFEGTN